MLLIGLSWEEIFSVYPIIPENETSIQFTNVCAIGEYGVVSAHSFRHPDHCDVLNTPDSE